MDKTTEAGPLSAMTDSYEELEQAWLDGEMSHAEACEIAAEMGYVA